MKYRYLLMPCISMAFSLGAMEKKNNEGLPPRDYVLWAIDIRLESMKQEAEVARQLDRDDLERHKWKIPLLQRDSLWEDPEKFNEHIQPMIELLLVRDKLESYHSEHNENC